MTRIAAPRGVAWSWCVLALAALVGCANEDGGRTQRSAGGDSAAALAQPPPGSARISGRVTYAGAPPEFRPVRMSADPYCVKANEGTNAPGAPEVGSEGRLAGVFVYVANGLEAYRYPPPKEAVVLDQQRCVYAPKVLGVQAGQPLDIRNSDETLHNVHAIARNHGGFNIGMPQKGMSAVRRFAAPEVFVRIKCDVHPWMAAYVGVVAHPFYAVTSGDGAYEVVGLPAGEYTISAVHPELGDHVEKITLGDGGAARVNFEFSD